MFYPRILLYTDAPDIRVLFLKFYLFMKFSSEFYRSILYISNACCSFHNQQYWCPKRHLVDRSMQPGDVCSPSTIWSFVSLAQLLLSLGLYQTLFYYIDGFLMYFLNASVFHLPNRRICESVYPSESDAWVAAPILKECPLYSFVFRLQKDRHLLRFWSNHSRFIPFPSDSVNRRPGIFGLIASQLCSIVTGQGFGKVCDFNSIVCDLLK